MKYVSPSLQWYPSDILASARVAAMSLEEEGAYRRALDYCWINVTLPNNPRALANIIGKNCSLAVAKRVAKMFVVDAKDKTVLRHDRLDAEREKQDKFHERQRNSGIASGKARKRANQNEPPFNLVPTKPEPALVEPKGNSSSSSSDTSKQESTSAQHSTDLAPAPSDAHPPSHFGLGPIEDRHGRGPATQDELREYCTQRGIPRAHGERFYLQYESKNWLDGSGIPITNWRAKLSAWWYDQQRHGGNIAGRAGPAAKPDSPRIPGGGVPYKRPEGPVTRDTGVKAIGDVLSDLKALPDVPAATRHRPLSERMGAGK